MKLSEYLSELKQFMKDIPKIYREGRIAEEETAEMLYDVIGRKFAEFRSSFTKGNDMR